MRFNIFPLILLLFTAGCATVEKFPVELHPAQFSETLSPSQTIQLRLDTGVDRNIKADSKWRYIGDITSGKVYKPVDDVFSIEGTQQYEAYLVVSSGKIVGFYLPASSNFSPLKKQVTFP
jgi:hypothetical protein